MGPARKFDVPTTEDERLRQQVRVMGMLDEVLKVQDRGDLLWIENRVFLPRLSTCLDERRWMGLLI